MMEFCEKVLVFSYYILLFSSAQHEIFSNVEVAFFIGPNYYPEYFALPFFENIQLHPAFDKNRTSMIYIHGYKESLSSNSVRTVITAYLTRNDTNVFALDWSNYSTGNYITDAIPHVIGIGQFMGICLYYWIEHGVLDDSRLHLVGHSLGAQMSGYIGKWLQLFSRGRKKIKRITGLDPAKPLWYHNLTSLITYIHKDDAVLVDIIHTNAGFLGTDISVGNCDFYPNGGKLQPGCSITSDPRCHHARSWVYYAESITSKEPSFDAVHCDSYSDFKKLNCSSDSPPTFMGLHAYTECSGVYFLQTNPNSPFSRGVFGLQYYPGIDSDRQIEANEEN